MSNLRGRSSQPKKENEAPHFENTANSNLNKINLRDKNETS